jgi:hypothetical protein
VIKLGPAELAELDDFALATSSSDGSRIETHRVLARANQDCVRRLRHAQLFYLLREGMTASGLASTPLRD